MTLTALGCGPIQGIFDSNDPFDDASKPNMGQDAQNMYCPDGSTNTGFYARPGFAQCTPALTTTAGQAVVFYTMTMLDGTIYRFKATNGKLYRLTGTAYATETDVTPVGVTISNAAAPTARFYMQSFADELIFSDGVNRPWRGTNLGSTPITGTYIDMDGAGGSWTAQGQPVVFAGALFFICKTVPGGSSVVAGLGMIWSEPFQPAVGYVQSGYADFWNMVEQASAPLYALWATNAYLYYFRERSIGALAGAPNVNFSTTASADAVSTSVGCTAPASICQFGDTIFFVDNIGRPYSFSGTDTPRELWKQLRGQIDANPSYIANPTATALVGIGCVVPQLNVVLLGGWSSSPTNSPPLGPTTLYCFDAASGQYYGRWSGAATSGLTTFDGLAQMKDSTGASTIAAYSTGTNAHNYLLSLLSAANWKDNAIVPTRNIKTHSLGYSANVVWNATDTGTVITQSAAPLTITVQTPYTASSTEITAGAPASSSDSTYRTVFGMDVLEARGIELTITPTTAEAQWIFQRVEFPADSSLAYLSDQ